MTFNFQNIEHMLKNFSSLPKESLAAITDEDLHDYETEFTNYDAKTREDITERDSMARTMLDSIQTLFGSGSNVYRYFQKKLQLGEDLVSAHEKKYIPPSRIRRDVLESREKYAITNPSSGGVDDTTMANIDDCISYLMEKEFIFGRDFNAHNAIDIAKGVAKDNALDLLAEGEGEFRKKAEQEYHLNPNDKVAEFTFDNSKFHQFGQNKVLVSDTWYRFRIDFQDSKPSLMLMERV